MEETAEIPEKQKDLREETNDKINTLFQKWKDDDFQEEEERELLEDLSWQMRMAEKEGLNLKFEIKSDKPLPNHPAINRNGKNIVITIDPNSEDRSIFPDSFMQGRESSLEKPRLQIGFRVGDDPPIFFEKSEIFSITAS